MPAPEEFARRLAAESLDAGDSTGWFERLYAAAASGEAQVPWDRGTPHPQLVEWAAERELDGTGHSALVVGAGPGLDAEHLAELGYDTVAFDVSETAVATARQRSPESTVDYQVADLLDLPASWRGAFDLVVESLTVQSLPVEFHVAAIESVTSTVAPAGTLLVIAAVASDEPESGPPWPLTRTEIESFATESLRPVRIEQIPSPLNPGALRWRAEFRRDE